MQDNKKILGNAAETEQTYVEVFRLGEAIKSNKIDWTTLGMLHYVLHEAVQKKVKPVPARKVEAEAAGCCIS